MIESRIVIANNDFARDLGVRFGLSGATGSLSGNQLMMGGARTSSGADNGDPETTTRAQFRADNTSTHRQRALQPDYRNPGGPAARVPACWSTCPPPPRPVRSIS